MDLKTYLEQPLVTTGLKVFGTAVAATILKTKQSIESISEESIQQFLMDNAVNIEREIKKLMKSCIGERNMTNVPEEQIIDNLICKVISLGEKNQELSEESLLKLSSILNVFSKDKFIAMPKKAYETEKKANRNAIFKGALASSIVGATVDTTLNAIKFDKTNPDTKEIREFLKAGPPPKTEAELATKSIIASSISVGASAGLAMYGIEILKKINSVVPDKYKPQLKKITTAIINKIKQKEKTRQLILSHIGNAGRMFINDWTKTVIENPEVESLEYTDRFGNTFQIDTYLVFKVKNGRVVMENGFPIIKPMEKIRNIKYNPKARVRSSPRFSSSDVEVGSTDTIYEDIKIKVINSMPNYKSQIQYDEEIKQLKDLFYRFVKAYSKKDEPLNKVDFLQLSTEFNPLLENLNISNEEVDVDDMIHKIERIEREHFSKKSMSEKTVHLITKPVSGITATFKSLFSKGRGRGRGLGNGKKTRKHKKQIMKK